ncbi:hypothetical protein [Nesterenkonia haasae]|uniref:hypothetical protein n=1 Tax=Nesterenkonia haasae TaxID=2587813 RepID=UPI001390BE0C|nr:hypothetical protein [Nesterenkonia haasae]
MNAEDVEKLLAQKDKVIQRLASQVANLNLESTMAGVELEEKDARIKELEAKNE